MSAPVTIRGSWGHLTVDRATGVILAYDPGDTGDDEIGYHDILFILPETLAPGLDACLDKYGETDILSIGYVDADGIVTRPMRFDPDVEMWAEPIALLPDANAARRRAIREDQDRRFIDWWNSGSLV